MSETTTHDDKKTRRDFLYVATGTVGAVGVGMAVWPLIDQMNPDASTLALSSIEVDISSMSPGTQITVMWRGKPVFIRRRTQSEIEEARNVDVASLPDPIARNDNLSADASADDLNRAVDEKEEWLVMVGICTHLGCVPLGDGAGEFGGWFCPCHGSHYDTAGRIRKGPASENMAIPPATFITETTIKLG